MKSIKHYKRILQRFYDSNYTQILDNLVKKFVPKVKISQHKKIHVVRSQMHCSS